MKSFSELTSASQVNNGDLLAISQTSGSGYASKKTTVKDITDKSNLNLAEEYDSTSTYAVDDYVIYESVLYKCISATTGAFDSTKWTSVVVTDEMGSGGGGGTGGHTIIDENGNSMTARAGLQFVGGANVSDDATNNKTIVDISGGGGGFGLVQSGHTVYTLTGQNLEDRVSITFDTPFPEVPNVAVSLSDPSRGQSYNPQTGLGVMNATKNGFEILIKSSNSAVAGDIIIYWIATTKFSGNGIFQPVIYSLEEREIGVWADGKPLYERTFDLGSDTDISYNSWTETTISWQTISVERLVGAKGFTSSGGTFAGTLLASKKSNGKVEIQTPRNNFNSGVRYLTLQYTKSTDVAGSGSWTPQGVPTHHYSTDEQVVGTWIDGSTLYEKTIFEQPTYSSHTASISIGNVNVHNIKGGVETSAGADNIAFGYTNVNPEEYVRAYQSGTNLSIYNSFDSSRPYVCATIQYTKPS